MTRSYTRRSTITKTDQWLPAELIAKRKAAVFVGEIEPFDWRERTDKIFLDHRLGFDAGTAGQPSDETKNASWQRGWTDAKE